MFVQTQNTPNPNSLKFIPEAKVSEVGPLEFLDINKTDNKLIKKVKDKGFKVAVETNGTLPVSNLIDWVCVSPKIKSELVVTKGDEIKVVYPQDGVNLSVFVPE